MCRRAGPACFVLLALGRGRLRRRRAEGDARFLGRRARRGGASRGARILGCANHGGDATRRVLLAGSPWPGRRPPVSLGRRPRAHLRGRASRYASTQRAGRVSNGISHFISSRTSSGLSRPSSSAFLRPNEREKTGCQPGISFRFHTHGRLERSFDSRRLAARADSVAPRCGVSSLTRTLAIGTVAESPEALEGAGGVDCRP